MLKPMSGYEPGLLTSSGSLLPFILGIYKGRREHHCYAIPVGPDNSIRVLSSTLGGVKANGEDSHDDVTRSSSCRDTSPGVQRHSWLSPSFNLGIHKGRREHHLYDYFRGVLTIAAGAFVQPLGGVKTNGEDSQDDVTCSSPCRDMGSGV
jgi:hypothetical protein